MKKPPFRKSRKGGFLSSGIRIQKDGKSILGEMHEVLNEGGQLIIVDFDKLHEISHPKSHNGFKHEELKNRLSNAGFYPLGIRTFHHGERIFMNRDASMFISISSK